MTSSPSFLCQSHCILRFNSKDTTFAFGNFTTIYGHFFCQLHRYLSQNVGADSHFEVLNKSKSQLDQKLQDKTQHFLSPLFFNFGRKNLENLWLLNDPFLTLFGHFFANYMKIFHKTEAQTVILRCLVCLNLNWIKS